MGTTVAHIYASVKPRHAKKYLRSIVSLAPIGHNTHSSSPILKTLAAFKTLLWVSFSFSFYTFTLNNTTNKKFNFWSKKSNQTILEIKFYARNSMKKHSTTKTSHDKKIL